MKTFDTSFTDALEEQTSRLADMRTHWRNNKETYQKVFDILSEDNEDESTSFTIDRWNYNISTFGGKEDLLKVIRALRRCGFSSTKKPGENISSWFAYYKNENGAEIYFSFSSTVCKRVKVRTEMQEVDIYETVCSDDVTELPELEI